MYAHNGEFMAKKSYKPTLNVAQLIHIIYQLENVTGHSVDDMIDMIISGNVSASLKQLILDTFERIKDDPLDVGLNAIVYSVIYKLLKRNFSSVAGRIDCGFFYLKPI